MIFDSENVSGNHRSQEPNSPDCRDWITKYLELADKIIGTYMPERVRQINQH